ncbi:MAG TPA: serine/threonine-protein kinase [Planktothrix sp.]
MDDSKKTGLTSDLASSDRAPGDQQALSSGAGGSSQPRTAGPSALPTAKAAPAEASNPGPAQTRAPGSRTIIDGQESLAPSDDPFLGTVIDGKYEILEYLGGGGAGLVYKAKHALMKKLLAIKVLFPHLSVRADVVKRFQLEAEASSRLNHPNIISVHDFGIAQQGQPYLVMDYVEGSSLDDILTRRGRFAAERVVAVMVQTCAALEHAHSRGIVHRDMKPSNIMLTRGEHSEEIVKLVDFGLAKAFAREGENIDKLTQTGEVFGSPAYMSPEQCKGWPVDHRADIYSVGCILFELLTGRMAFQGETAVDTLLKQINEPPPPLDLPDAPPSVRQRFEAIILKALAKEPNKRYQSMAEMGNDLAKVMQAENIVHAAKTRFYVTYLKMFGFDPNVVMSRKKVLIFLPALLILGAAVMFAYVVFADIDSSSRYQKIVRWEVTQAPVQKAPSTLEEQFAKYILTISPADQMVNAKRDGMSTWASRYMASHQYDKAEKLLSSLYQIACKVDGPTSIIAANAVFDMGNCYYEEGKYLEAQKCYSRGLATAIPIVTVRSELLALPESRLGQICYMRGQFKQARQQLANALNAWTRARKQDTPEYALSLSTMAQVYEQQSEYGSAARLFDAAGKMWLHFGGIERRNAITCYTAAGTIHNAMKQWKDAHGEFETASRIAEQEYGANSAEVANVLNNDAGTLIQKGDYLRGIKEKIRAKLILWNSSHA